MQDIPAYAAMVESLDENIGRLLDTLHRSGLDERTIVVFTSDNGGMATSNTTRNIPTSNLPLRAGKDICTKEASKCLPSSDGVDT